MRSLIVANWKCNPTTQEEAKRLFNSVKRGIKNIKNSRPLGSRRLSFEVEVVICPPFVYIPLLNPKSYILNPKLGAQNCFWEEKGAFTGEIPPKMLKNLGCQYVIIGHSERERYFGETDEMTSKKIKAAILAKLKPILCIGEIKKEKQESKIKKVLGTQLKVINNLTSEQFSNLIIAYEPVWAIGTGKPCPPKKARIGLLIVREVISNLYNSSFGEKIKILYGGSINSKIAKEYIEKAGFQGLLIGGASLVPQEFIKIIKVVSKIN